MICVECGNDDACEGYSLCTDCMEELGHVADAYVDRSYLSS